MHVRPIKLRTYKHTKVDKIRELAAGKRAGEISEEEFADQKRRLLEMEKLRREAEEEAMRRAKVRAVHRYFNGCL